MPASWPATFLRATAWRRTCGRLRQTVWHAAPFVALRTRRRTARHRARLEAACVPVHALGADVERRFLAIGASLRQQVELTAQLTTQSQALTRFAATRSEIEAAVRLVMTADLDVTGRLATEVARLAATLEQHAGRLGALLGTQQQLERSFAPMRPLQSFFRIESATLSSELQGQFHAVTTDMARLHQDVSASFAANAAALEHTRAEALAAAGRLHRQASADRDVILETRAQVEATLGRLQREFELACDRHRRLDEAIGGLNRATDEITVSLQYQDITRQKIEHVETAARELLSDQPVAGAGDAMQRARVQQVLCEVQAAQLTAAQAEIEQAADAVTGGIAGVLERLQSIERDSLSVERLTASASSMDEAVAGAAHIRDVTRKLTREALAGLAEAIETARRLTHATTGATDTMRRLAADLHLMGLNAQVQAVRANNGSLEVLSRAVAVMSAEAGQLAVAFEGDLAHTTSTVQSFITGSEQQYREILQQSSELQARHDATAGRLEEQHRAANDMVAQVNELLRELRSHAENLLSSTELTEFSCAPLAEMRTAFVALGQAYADGPAGAAPANPAPLSSLHRRYTMQSERDAHDAVIGAAPITSAPASTETGAPVAAVAVPPEPSANGGDAALGANIELF